MDREDFWAEMSDWSNHKVMLWYALEETKTGTVLELGCGGGSTPYLHQYCKDNNRKLISFDTDLDWISQFVHLQDNNHQFIHVVNNWHIAKDICPNPSVILCDEAPGEIRKVNIERFKDIEGILCVHDSQPPLTAADYKFEEIWPLFKYRVNLALPLNTDVDPPHQRTWASMISNTYDVRKFIGFETGNPDYKIV